MKIAQAVLALLLRAAIFYILFCAALPLFGLMVGYFDWSPNIVLETMRRLWSQTIDAISVAPWLLETTAIAVALIQLITRTGIRAISYLALIGVSLAGVLAAEPSTMLAGPIVVAVCLLLGIETRELLERIERLVSRFR